MFFKEALLRNNECLFNVVVLIENIIPSKEFNDAACRDIYKFNLFCNRKREYFSTLCKKSREIKPSSASYNDCVYWTFLLKNAQL